MPFGELRGYAREVFLDQKIEELGNLYRRAQKDLKKKLLDVDITDFQKMRTEALLLQVNRELVTLDKSVRGWSKKNLEKAYEHGLDLSQERLQKMGVTRYVNFDARIHRTAINVLVDDVTVDFLTANQTIKNNVNRFIRLTQQRVLEDKHISKMIAQGMIQGETRRTISDEILKGFRDKMGNEQFITINGRNYRPDAYSRLVARTRFVEASNRASINSSLQYGVDLVQVSVHSHQQEDPCSPYQGKIYSISGADPDFPPLTVSPPYHPNCKHQLLPITRESLEDRGLLEGSKKFSNSNRSAGTFSEFEKDIGAKKETKKKEVKPEIARRGHLKGVESWEERKEVHKQILKDLNLPSTPENIMKAKETEEALREWGGREYARIRDYQKDPALFKQKYSDWKIRANYSDNLENYIRSAPSYEGSMMRGIGLSGKNVGSFNPNDIQIGGIIFDKGTTSWSSDKNVARGYGSVVFRTKNVNSSASITHVLAIDNPEKEILVGKGTKFKVTGKTIYEDGHEYFGAGKTKTTVFDMEEII